MKVTKNGVVKEIKKELLKNKVDKDSGKILSYGFLDAGWEVIEEAIEEKPKGGK